MHFELPNAFIAEATEYARQLHLPQVVTPGFDCGCSCRSHEASAILLARLEPRFTDGWRAGIALAVGHEVVNALLERYFLQFPYKTLGNLRITAFLQVPEGPVGPGKWVIRASEDYNAFLAFYKAQAAVLFRLADELGDLRFLRAKLLSSGRDIEAVAVVHYLLGAPDEAFAAIDFVSSAASSPVTRRRMADLRAWIADLPARATYDD